MNVMDELIDKTIAALDTLSEEEKKKYKEIFTQIFKEGKTPSEVLGFNSEMVEHMYAYGYRLYNLGNYKKALNVFIGMNMFNPNDPRFHLALGACYHKLKEYVKAVDSYYICSVLEPHNPMPHYFMYDCFLQADMWGDAAFCLEEVIKRCANKKEWAELKARCVLLLEPLKAKIAELNAKIKENAA